MAELVSISIPQPLYQRVRRLARVRKRPLDDVLESAVQLAEAEFVPIVDDEIHEPEQLSFSTVRHLLRDVEGSMSQDIIDDREDRI